MNAQTIATEAPRRNGSAAFQPDAPDDHLWFYRDDGTDERFRLDQVEQCLHRRAPGAPDRRVALTPKAFAVLNHLIECAGRLITQDEFLDVLWPGVCVQPEALKHQILSLRTVLRDDARKPRFIETLSRRGYRFIARIATEAGAGQVDAQACMASRSPGLKRPLAELSAAMQRAIRGRQREVVFVAGETGSGNTSLLDEFIRSTRLQIPRVRIARGECIEGYGGKEAYYPVLEALGDLCRGERAGQVLHALACCAPSWLSEFPGLVPPEQRRALLARLASASRERMPREMKDALERLGQDTPLVLVLEDLQWADACSVGLIEVLARTRTPMPLLLLGTHRPTAAATDGGPLQSLLPELRMHGLCTELRSGPSPALRLAHATPPEAVVMQ